MWPILQKPAEQYFGKTLTALLQEGLGWGKLPAKPTATDCKPGKNRGCLQELSHFHMQSAPSGNRKSVKGDLWCQLLCSTGERYAGITTLLSLQRNSEFPLLGCVWWKYRSPMSHSNVALVPSALLEEKLQSQELSPAQGIWGLWTHYTLHR